MDTNIVLSKFCLVSRRNHKKIKNRLYFSLSSYVSWESITESLQFSFALVRNIELIDHNGDRIEYDCNNILKKYYVREVMYDKL